ncbi:MAG: phosphate ABC transporter ATP-binding protein [Anaerolineales bacterium]
MGLYELRGLARDYAGRRVLAIEDLQIERGEIFCVVGPSGAGKSTLLRLLGFVEPPSAGTLTFDGQPVLPGGPALDQRRRVTLVFQRPALLKRTVAENVALGLRLRRQPDALARVRAALGRVGLASLASARAGSLSGGEVQRAALARALVLEPDVLLLDEPTANLDPYNVGLIESLIREQNQFQKTTVLLVTHNVFQARRLAHRVGLLLDGKLVEAAPVEDFFNRPRDPRVVAFARGEMVY